MCEGVGWGIGGCKGEGNGMREKSKEMGGRICQGMCLGVCVDGTGDTRRRGRMGGYLAQTPPSFHALLRWEMKTTTVDAPPSTFGQGRTFVAGPAMTQSGKTELIGRGHCRS